MLVETLSGKCPCCGHNKLVQRYGSSGYHQMDACPKCGFGYATNHHDYEYWGVDAWYEIFKIELDIMNISYEEDDDVQLIREKVYRAFKTHERSSEIKDTVFQYTQDDIEKHKALGMKIFDF